MSGATLLFLGVAVLLCVYIWRTEIKHLFRKYSKNSQLQDLKGQEELLDIDDEISGIKTNIENRQSDDS